MKALNGDHTDWKKKRVEDSGNPATYAQARGSPRANDTIVGGHCPRKANDGNSREIKAEVK